jgi:hypothetical protein
MKRIQSVNKNYIELSGEIRFETERAILFCDGNKEVWLPRSQIEDIDLTTSPPSAVITIPEWLAENKELI